MVAAGAETDCHKSTTTESIHMRLGGGEADWTGRPTDDRQTDGQSGKADR